MINDENLKRENFENYKKEEEKEMIDMEERKELMEYIERQLWDEGFNEDGDLLVNLENVTSLEPKKIIEVIEAVGLECEPANDKDYYWVSLPENFKETHKQRVEELEEEIDFEIQGRMTDAEMCEFLDAYITANKEDLEKFGFLYLDTFSWKVVIEDQIIRCAEYLGYECKFFYYDGWENDAYDGMFIIRKPDYEE